MTYDTGNEGAWGLGTNQFGEDVSPTYSDGAYYDTHQWSLDGPRPVDTYAGPTNRTAAAPRTSSTAPDHEFWGPIGPGGSEEIVNVDGQYC